MRSSVLALMLLMLFPFSEAQGGNSLAMARKKFFKAGKDPCLAEELQEITEGLDENPVRAYYGASFTMMADCVKSPIKKLKNFNKGRDIIEEAVLSDPGDPEIRFIRFMVQDRAPAFLGYDNRTEDLEVLMQRFREAGDTSGGDDFLVQMAKAISHSGFPDEEQKKTIHKIIIKTNN
jgi:hypothetical protein